MPTYEMYCEKCDKAFEISLNFAERDAKAKCPSCGGKKLQQVYSSHILLKKNKSSCSSCTTCSPGKCGGCQGRI